jgi:hypothetical protein
MTLDEEAEKTAWAGRGAVAPLRGIPTIEGARGLLPDVCRNVACSAQSTGSQHDAARGSAKHSYKKERRMKIIDKGSAKPDDPIYAMGPVIGGVRWHSPTKDTQPKMADNSPNGGKAAITPEEAEKHGKSKD